jgi:hypothetical protein
VLEDPPLQVSQLPARLKPELAVQTGAKCGVDVERLRLPPAAIQGEHRLRLKSLTQRMLSGEAAELR